MKMPESFLADLSVERVSPLLWCKAVEQRGQKGWRFWFDVINQKVLQEQSPPRQWEPFVVTEAQFKVMNALCIEGKLSLDHPLIRDLSVNEKLDLNALFDMRLIAKKDDGIVLLTRLCRCAIMPSGVLVVGDDSSGRMTAWVEREILRRAP